MSDVKNVPQTAVKPEDLAFENAKNVAPLSDVFCSCMQGKVAIVTGGATGLGYNAVNRLSEAGAKVVIASRSEARGRKAEAEFRSRNRDVTWVQTDVSKVSDCYHTVDETVKIYGKVDVLVTAAAGWSSYAYLDVPEELFDHIMETDLKGSYFIGQAVARHMVANKIKGKIVFISSAAYKGEAASNRPMNSYYAAAKAGVVAMTKSIAGELDQYGIGVNCVAPGGMKSHGLYSQGTEAASLYGQAFIDAGKTAVRPPIAANPDMVALAVFAMCTPMSDFMSGTTIDVDGGVLMHRQVQPFSFTVEGCVPGPKA